MTCGRFYGQCDSFSRQFPGSKNQSYRANTRARWLLSDTDVFNLRTQDAPNRRARKQKKEQSLNGFVI
jgi:F420-dependent methylenetetrahydromethanopterin dehydrogenase